VIVGADRVAANGDTANKIGTLQLAIVSSFYNIPFYVAAPLTTIDLNTRSGDEIQIEHRSGDEITLCKCAAKFHIPPEGKKGILIFFLAINFEISHIFQVWGAGIHLLMSRQQV